jgi:hypothetical protein
VVRKARPCPLTAAALAGGGRGLRTMFVPNRMIKEAITDHKGGGAASNWRTHLNLENPSSQTSGHPGNRKNPGGHLMPCVLR